MRRLAAVLSLLLAALMMFQPLGSATAQIAVPTSKDPLYTFSQYQIPQNSSQPGAITTDGGGNIWFVEQAGNVVASFDPSTGTFAAYPIPTANSIPQGIAVDAQGAVWFAELAPGKLGEIPPGSSTVREFDIPLGPDNLGCGPIGVTPHAGSIWITCEFSNQIDEFNPSDSSFREFDLPLIFSAPIQIVFDRSGNFWFTAADVGMLGYATVAQLQPGTADGFSEFAPINSSYITTISNPLLPGGGVRTSLSIPSGVALSPDGNSLWITEHGGSSFDHYEIGSKSLVKYFTSASSFTSYPNSLPNGIAIDAQGNIWIAEHGANKVAEFDPSTGSMVEYSVPCCGAGIAGVLYLALGPNGSVWFTEFFGNAIGELTPEAGIPPASVNLNPGRIELGPTAEAMVSIEVSWGTAGQEAGQNFSFQASGITNTGSLQNATASFSPAIASLGSNSTYSTTLTISTMGLSPGTYYLTIGAVSSSTGTTSSRFLVLTVPGGNQDLLLEIGVIAAAILALGALFTVMRARKGKGEKQLQKDPGLRSGPRVGLDATPGIGQAALIALLAL